MDGKMQRSTVTAMGQTVKAERKCPSCGAVVAEKEEHFARNVLAGLLFVLSLGYSGGAGFKFERFECPKCFRPVHRGRAERIGRRLGRAVARRRSRARL